MPVDGSIYAINAVSYANDLADKCGAKLNLLYVLQSGESFILPEHIEKLIEETSAGKSEADRILAAAMDRIALCDRSRISKEIREGDPAGEILKFSREKGIDLIVMGDRGVGDLQGLLLGSVSHKVVQAAECPCLLYGAAKALDRQRSRVTCGRTTPIHQRLDSTLQMPRVDLVCDRRSSCDGRDN